MKGIDGVNGRVIVCAPASLPAFFRDDLYGNCVFCSERVRFRPHNPAPRVLVCIACYLLRVEHGDEYELTQKTIEELAALAPWTSVVKVPQC